MQLAARFRYHNHYHADVRVVTISGPAKTVSAAGVVVCSVRGPRHDAIVHGRYGTTTPSDEMAGVLWWVAAPVGVEHQAIIRQ